MLSESGEQQWTGFCPEEITVIRDRVIRFMETEVNPVVNEIEKSGVFSQDIVK